MKGMKIGVLMAVLMVLVGSATAATYVHPRHADGTSDTQFDSGEEVHATGGNFYSNAGKVCRVYVMENGDWAGDPGQTCPLYGTGIYCVNVTDPIPAGQQVAGPVDVTIDQWGAFGLTKIWASAAPGEYDVLVDCENSAGEYGTWDGITNDGVIKLTCIGFFVVPESVIAVALIALLVPGMIYVVRKRR